MWILQKKKLHIDSNEQKLFPIQIKNKNRDFIAFKKRTEQD